MTIIYVTKGCLTGGIMKFDAHETSIDGMYCIDGHGTGGIKAYAHKGEYCFTEQEALDRAKVMRDKKIAILKKQIAKLEGMDFGGDK